MSLRSLLAPLWRVFAGREPQEDAASFSAESMSLLAQLGLPAETFRDILENGSLAPHFHYRHFRKPKKGGGHREVVEPDPRLKLVQRTLLGRRLEVEQPHPAAVAYRPGKSIADHAWTHAGAEILVTADVRDFFPSTAAGRVEDWWRERVEADLARLLTLLTTYRGGLPQGAPTSPALSNLVNRDLDARLAARATAARARYSRYCDDLAFSWRSGRPPADFEPAVRAVLHEFGYELRPEKGWQTYEGGDEPEVVGVILTRHGRVRLPDEMRRRMRELAASDAPGAADRLEGYRAYERMVTRRPKRRK